MQFVEVPVQFLQFVEHLSQVETGEDCMLANHPSVTHNEHELLVLLRCIVGGHVKHFVSVSTQVAQLGLQRSQVGRDLFSLRKNPIGLHSEQVKAVLLYPKPVWQLVHFVVLSVQFAHGAVHRSQVGIGRAMLRNIPGASHS